ncbi:MAG: DUF4189 domain-containing protein [Mycobacterium sp.]
MIGTSFQTRAALAAAGAAAVAALSVAVAPAAFADDDAWGAIAVSTDGQHVGKATDLPNEYTANGAANSDCNQNQTTCNVLVTFKYPDCGAVVKNGDQYFGDIGPTKQAAEQNAMNQSPGSTVLHSECNTPPPGEEATSTTPSATTSTTSSPSQPG